MAERSGAADSGSSSATRPRWLLPLVAITTVALLGAAVAAIAFARPAQQVGTATESAAIPTPAPTVQPSPPSAAANQVSAQEHQQYRTYVSTVIVDTTAVVAATLDLAGCRSDRTQCVHKLNEAGDQVSSFQRDLLTTPAPPCLSHSDDLLRDGLGFLKRGFDAARKGVSRTDRVQVMQGILLLGAGWWRGGQAMRSAREANC
jgi:hypothetical protein